jgi:exonuclease V gamma subunit
MSVLYLGSELQSVAARMADVLIAEEGRGDFFSPVTVVVPNRYLRKWLRLFLARRLGVSINLRYLHLEDALWEWLRRLDPRQHPATPEPLDENAYRLLVLSVLLEDREPSLATLQRYIGLQSQPLPRLSCRRAWQLADRIGLLIRDYEYHRQSLLIQPWLRQQLGLSGVSDFHHLMERAQRALFQNVTRPRDGRRALLNQLSGRYFKTFPQYAMELMEQPPPPVGTPLPVVHFFGFTQVTELHTHVIGWLGRAIDVRYYHVNVLAARARGTPTAASLQTVAQTLRDPADADQAPDRGRSLLRSWGRAGAEALGLMAGLVERGAFEVEALPPAVARPVIAARRRAVARKPPATVLARLQDHLMARPTQGARRLPQDTSLQIVGCPGALREVETVYNSILHNLHLNPRLRQTDFAVLVTDMPRYRPILQAVFERPPRRLQYNLVDFSASGLSVLGQSLLGMLDLALESFTRSGVFGVLLNPCFLARLGVDRAQALTWLGWAETLGIYQGWDASEKHEQGYARSPFYAWRLGLQRLRLGRYMEVAPDDADEPPPRFGHVLPFADVHCSDREHLDAFCRAVETLLPTLARLRTWQGSGQRWAATLQRLVQDFLDVPLDRPEEGQVREDILAALERLALWDHLRPGWVPPAGLPLALVREYVQTQLEALEGSRGEYLTGGVTLSALQPMRPVPFQVVYVIGLGEDLFPGSNALSSFDLRGVRREPGDIRPAEEKSYLFLEALVAVQQKVYLLYNNVDLQKDQALQPSVPLQQLQRYLGHHIGRGDFQTVSIPPHNDDDVFINQAQQPDYQDVLVQYREADRFLALARAEQEGRLTLDLHQKAELSDRAEQLRVDFSLPPDPPPALATPVTVSVGELRRFLHFPARESLRRHLRVEDDTEIAIEDEEPLVTPPGPANQLVRQALHQLVRRAAAGDVPRAFQEWPDRFRAAYADGRLRSRVPEDAFGELDEAMLRRELHERIHGRGALEPFLRARADMMFCGPALLGESVAPVGAKMRFPALRLRPGHELPAGAGPEVRVVGTTPLAWLSRDTFEVLVITTSSKVDGRDLCLPMIEPTLFFLALLANPEPNGKAIASRDWLGRRHFFLHLAHPEGILTWTHPIGLFSPDEATRYLAGLAQDFLDPTQLDLLPFELITRGAELRRVYYERGDVRLSAEEYQQLLEENLAEERENVWYSAIDIPLVVDMAQARVPADALAKVQRRFRLLDRGPALWREGSESRRLRKSAPRATP